MKLINGDCLVEMDKHYGAYTLNDVKEIKPNLRRKNIVHLKKLGL